MSKSAYRVSGLPKITGQRLSEMLLNLERCIYKTSGNLINSFGKSQNLRCLSLFREIPPKIVFIHFDIIVIEAH